jgi:hypothetical protein
MGKVSKFSLVSLLFVSVVFSFLFATQISPGEFIEMFATSNKPDQAQVSLTVSSTDEAVMGYMHIAQIQAGIYAFTNNGSYSGLCEPSPTLNSLSENIFIYIKHVGATDLFCSNDADSYLIQARLPDSQKFICVDSLGTRDIFLDNQKDNSYCY